MSPSILFATLLSLAGCTGASFEQPHFDSSLQPVELRSAKVLTRLGFLPVMRTSLTGVVETGSLGSADAVTVHYQIREAHDVSRDWTTAEATELLPGIWQFTTPSFDAVLCK